MALFQEGKARANSAAGHELDEATSGRRVERFVVKDSELCELGDNAIPKCKALITMEFKDPWETQRDWKQYLRPHR